MGLAWCLSGDEERPVGGGRAEGWCGFSFENVGDGCERGSGGGWQIAWQQKGKRQSMRSIIIVGNGELRRNEDPNMQDL